ncbi:MAG: Der GTPase-activating protein YihI [Pseudomonadota bacterium]
MTRQKKSRKPGPLAPGKKPRDEKTSEKTVKGKKKGKGHQPGQRHSSGKSHTEQQTTEKQDPRKGSRRKIPLVTPLEPSSSSEMSPAEELKQLEQDVKLQTLVERFEQGEELSAEEQRYLDKKSERYEQLAEKLGIDIEDDWDDEEY